MFPEHFLKNDGGKIDFQNLKKNVSPSLLLIHQVFTKLNCVIVKSLDKLGHLLFKYHYIIIVYKFLQIYYLLGSSVVMCL